MGESPVCKALSLADFSITCHTPLVIGLPIVLVLSALMRHRFLKWPYAKLKFTTILVLCCWKRHLLTIYKFYYYMFVQPQNRSVHCLSNPWMDQPSVCPTPDKICLCLSNSLRTPSPFVQHPIICVSVRPAPNNMCPLFVQHQKEILSFAMLLYFNVYDLKRYLRCLYL